MSMQSDARASSLLLLLVACSVGTTGRNYAPAQGPAGATVTLDLTGQRQVGGELLAVEEATLLLRRPGELVRVPLRLITSGKAPKLSFTGATLTGETRERLRLISRYPQGVSAELEARLLEAYGQRGVQEISRAARLSKGRLTMSMLNSVSRRQEAMRRNS
jgi:hypothetical protein